MAFLASLLFLLVKLGYFCIGTIWQVMNSNLKQSIFESFVKAAIFKYHTKWFGIKHRTPHTWMTCGSFPAFQEQHLNNAYTIFPRKKSAPKNCLRTANQQNPPKNKNKCLFRHPLLNQQPKKQVASVTWPPVTLLYFEESVPHENLVLRTWFRRQKV